MNTSHFHSALAAKTTSPVLDDGRTIDDLLGRQASALARLALLLDIRGSAQALPGALRTRLMDVAHALHTEERTLGDRSTPRDAYPRSPAHRGPSARRRSTRARTLATGSRPPMP